MKIQKRLFHGLAVVAAAALLATGALREEPFRPQYHFSPELNWMNDPNGLVQYKGEYHLFFQYNPFGDRWGHMSWGHAVSPDLLHWEQLPVALPEQDGIMIFSGSAVVDWKNSSGLCRNPEPADESCLIAIYTGRTEPIQAQHIAFSNDRGRTWTKYGGNPVIDLGMQDFRDPKVFFHEASNQWVMATALSAENRLRLFGSPNLRDWTPLSDFGPEGAADGVWECPDLFELPVEGAAGETRWVLVVNLNPGGPAGGSGAQYFVGRFDGRRFVNENPPDEVLWIDRGKDFYAVQSYSDIPPADGRRVWIGWMSNWQYAAREPTSPWRTMQSIPREVTLRRTPDGDRLFQQPVRELESLRREETSVADLSIAEANRRLADRRGRSLEIVVELSLNGATSAGLKLRKGAAEETRVGVRGAPPEAFVDRSNSGATDFHEAFPGERAAPLRDADRATLRVLLDRSSVEVFVNDGEAALSERIFPSPGSDGIELFAEGGEARVKSLKIWSIESVWKR